jgi:anaerobic magnesium-protoporphyrin IX monomethyl ester cyclase
MEKRRVVLYNPECVFYTMPLALLAIGSRLDPSEYEVRVVDARLEEDPAGALMEALDGALCLGVTVLTGAPILDALAATRAAKARHPELPVVWGGWHPSLFPRETLAEAGIDAVVTGQGEDTFAEIVDRLREGQGLERIPGCHAAGSPAGALRLLRDINDLPAHDYGLIPVESYFRRKGWRQLDYISSQGCRFRCTFCADPHVYRRGWFGLDPERMGEELEGLWRRHAVEDVNFQDETFFTHPKRVTAIADEFLRRGTPFTWTATMRADQGFRLDEAALELCRRSGLRRVMIGVESGSPEMLERIRKDITLEQVFESAEKCLRQGIGALFNFIVGFPGETPESMAASLEVAKRLRSMSPDFEIAVFYYKPYPGNPMAQSLEQDGYRFPRSLSEWAEFDYVGSSGPWITPEQRRTVEGFKFYQRVAWARATPARAPLQALARWRVRRDFYGLPVEKAVIEWLRPPHRLS